jgi:hypothetical protein
MQLAILLLTMCLVGTPHDRAVKAASAQEATPDHVAWVAQVLKHLATIKPGMTRKDLLTVFTTEGGLSTRLRRTYVARECRYFKIDVEFRPVGRAERDGRVTLVEDDRDVIAAVSRPYLQLSILD